MTNDINSTLPLLIILQGTTRAPKVKENSMELFHNILVFLLVL